MYGQPLANQCCSETKPFAPLLNAACPQEHSESSKSQSSHQKLPNAQSKSKGRKQGKRGKQAGNSKQAVEVEQAEPPSPKKQDDFSFSTARSGQGDNLSPFATCWTGSIAPFIEIETGKNIVSFLVCMPNNCNLLI